MLCQQHAQASEQSEHSVEAQPPSLQRAASAHLGFFRLQDASFTLRGRPGHPGRAHGHVPAGAEAQGPTRRRNNVPPQSLPRPGLPAGKPSWAASAALGLPREWSPVIAGCRLRRRQRSRCGMPRGRHRVADRETAGRISLRLATCLAAQRDAQERRWGVPPHRPRGPVRRNPMSRCQTGQFTGGAAGPKRAGQGAAACGVHIGTFFFLMRKNHSYPVHIL